MQIENPYLYWYLVVISILILHGIFEGWCESQLEKKPRPYSYSWEWLENFHSRNLSQIFSFGCRSGKTTYLLLNLINKVQVTEEKQVVAIVKYNKDIKFHVSMLKPLLIEHGIYLVNKSSDGTLQVEYEGKTKIINFMSKRLYDGAYYGCTSEHNSINLIDY